MRLPLLLCSICFCLVACATSHSKPAETTKPAEASVPSPDARFTVGKLLIQDAFSDGLALWRTELEKGGTVVAQEGTLEIDVPAGCTVWLAAPLSGPVLISYEVAVVGEGGPNDRVSDLNCFWMAQDARSPGDIFSTARSGKFSDYDQLQCYYVGYGGNSNKTTRFRRYIGEKGNRPLLPEHDLSAPEFLITPNVSQTIQLVAAGSTIGYYREGRRLFAYEDPQPYTNGWFAFRTVTSHLKVKNFRVFRLLPEQHAPALPPAVAKP